MPFLTPTDIASYFDITFDTAKAARVQSLIEAVLAVTETSLGYDLTRSGCTLLTDDGQHRDCLPEPGIAIDFS